MGLIKMTRFLTGIQSSGEPHLGNILGAIIPAIQRGAAQSSKPFYFIADMHSLTTINNAEVRLKNTHSVAAAWLAFGCDPSSTVLYRQSYIPEVCELSWYLSCFTATGLLRRAHAYNEKKKAGGKPKAGLMYYPVLMAADILLYDASHVPVGKDQKEHIDITRDIARSMNHIYGDLFTIPEAVITSQVMVPGTDGTKMSKSKNNVINLFATDKSLRKSVMAINTDSCGINDSKDPDNCTVYELYKLVASVDETSQLREDYIKGQIGYGQAKTKLFEKFCNEFGEARERYNEIIGNPMMLETYLEDGEKTAHKEAAEKLSQVRKVLGFRS